MLDDEGVRDLKLIRVMVKINMVTDYNVLILKLVFDIIQSLSIDNSAKLCRHAKNGN